MLNLWDLFSPSTAPTPSGAGRWCYAAMQDTSSSRTARLAQIVHILAILAGALTIVANSAPRLGIPDQAAEAVGVVVAVLTYVANQLPSLGRD